MAARTRIIRLQDSPKQRVGVFATRIPSTTYLKRMTRAENCPEEGDLQDPGRHPAAGDHSDDQTDFQEEHQLQRPSPLHFLSLLYLQLHAACVPACATATSCDVIRDRERGSRNFRSGGTEMQSLELRG